MDTKNIRVAFRKVAKIWTPGVMYNISTNGKKITIKEKSMAKRASATQAMAAIVALTTTVNKLVITVTDGFADAKADRELIKKDIVDIKKDIVRLDQKIDNIVALNNLKT